MLTMMVSIVVMGDGDDDGDDDDGVDVDNVENDAYSRDSCRDDIADIFYDDNDFDGECNKKNGYEITFLGPKKSRFSGPTPSNAPRNDVAPLKTITYRAKNNRYIGSSMYPSAVVCCCVLLCARGVGRSPCSCVE